MLWHGAHRIIAYTGRYGSPKPRWVAEKGIEAAIAAVIEIKIYTSVMIENEISDGISTLDRIRIRVEGIEEPFVFFRDEGAGFLVSPEL